MPKKKRDTTKWFKPGRRTGWSKDNSQTRRRRAILASRRGNYLKAARALMALSNVSQDKETSRKSRADSLYFYKMHAKTGK